MFNPRRFETGSLLKGKYRRLNRRLALYRSLARGAPKDSLNTSPKISWKLRASQR
jgi:hypothetical protein